MERLSEVLNTQYLVNEYAQDLRYLLTNTVRCMNTGSPFTEEISAKWITDAINRNVGSDCVEYDIAGCRFTLVVWRVMMEFAMEYPDKIMFVDTEDADRDCYIKNYIEYNLHPIKDIEPLPPHPHEFEQFVAWQRGLSREVAYNASTGVYKEHPELVTMLLLMAPDIKVLAYNRTLFEYIRTVFNKYLYNECLSFKYLYGNADEFYETEVGEDDKVHITNIGDVPREEFISKYICIPAFIGEVPIAFDAASEAVKSGMRRIVQDVQNYLQESPITISSYLSKGD